MKTSKKLLKGVKATDHHKSVSNTASVGMAIKLRNFGGCRTCPVFEYCTYKDLLSEIQQERGCEDIRRIYFENIRQWKRPVTVLIRDAADIQTRIQLQQFIDGQTNTLASNEWHKLVRLKLDVVKEIMKYDPESNNPRILTSTFAKDAELIEMDPTLYDKDTLPDSPPVLHGNVNTDDYMEKRIKDLKKQEEEENCTSEPEKPEEPKENLVTESEEPQ